MNEFDFIVVGPARQAACWPNRLSEDGRNSVLLVEAGGSDRNPVFSVPILAGMAYFWPSSNWHYQTEPQPRWNGRASSGPAARCWAAPRRSTA